jgi:phosphoglycolate phosphatase
MRPFQTVLFDFDYTLADSSRGVIDCIAFALRQLGLPPVSPQEACRTIGLSLKDTLAALAGPEHAVLGDEFARLFIERADLVMADRTVLLRPVREVVAALWEPGLTLGIVSTKFRRRIEAVLRREGLLVPFAVVIGGEDVARHKPDPQGLLLALERTSSPAGQTLYVGDSLTDAETARRADVPFAAVLSGVTPAEAFRPYTLHALLGGLTELPSLVV